MCVKFELEFMGVDVGGLKREEVGGDDMVGCEVRCGCCGVCSFVDE